MFPNFRKDGHGRVILTDTQAAKQVKGENRQYDHPETYDDLKVSARRQCREQGGNDEEAKQWMGFLQLQWGAFRGETYRWLLENSPGYYGWMVNKMRQEAIPPTDKLFLHKMTFMKYVNMFPEGQQIVDLKAARIGMPIEKQTSNSGDATSVEDLMDNAADEELLVGLKNYEDNIEASRNVTQRVHVPQAQECIPEPGPSSVSDPQQLTSSGDDIPLTKKWKKTLPVVDQGWISKTFFVYGARGPQFDFDRVKKLWYDPPQPSLSRGILNKPDCFFGH